MAVAGERRNRRPDSRDDLTPAGGRQRVSAAVRRPDDAGCNVPDRVGFWVLRGRSTSPCQGESEQSLRVRPPGVQAETGVGQLALNALPAELGRDLRPDLLTGGEGQP